MDNSFVIDSSVVVKWLSPENEKGVESSARIYEQLQFGIIKLYAPTFLLAEVANILFWKKKLMGKGIGTFVQKLTQSGINFSDLNVDIMPEIIDLMASQKVSAYDSIFLQMAKKLNCKLISDDKKLIEIKDLVLGLDQF